MPRKYAGIINVFYVIQRDVSRRLRIVVARRIGDSRLDYCNVLWYSAPILDHLQQGQKSVARAVTKSLHPANIALQR